MRLHHTLSQYGEAFMRLIYPAVCGACPAFLELEEYPLCSACAGRVERLRFSQDDCLCEDVPSKRSELNEAWALYPYESPVREILQSVKFARKRWLLRVFETSLGEFVSSLHSENHYDYLVPVPVDRMKLIQREFNQSAVLAKMAGRGAQIPVLNALGKPRITRAQSGLSRNERGINLHGAFKIKHKVEDMNLLLVDDILTTGSTAREAARELKRAGARRVDLLTLARTEKNAAPETVRAAGNRLALAGEAALL